MSVVKKEEATRNAISGAVKSGVVKKGLLNLGWWPKSVRAGVSKLKTTKTWFSRLVRLDKKR